MDGIHFRRLILFDSTPCPTVTVHRSRLSGLIFHTHSSAIVLHRRQSDAVQSRLVFFTRVGSQTIDMEADDLAPGYFVRVPNELMLMFADCLDIDDINTLVRTSWAIIRLFTQYMYRRAKDRYSGGGRPYFLRAADTGNLTAVTNFIEVGASVIMSDTMDSVCSTALHTCAMREISE
jgi:hypothetical protein